MSVAIREIEGVESVEVSLNQGVADVKLKPGNHVDPERIRQVARDNGFTPKGAEVLVAGRLVEREGGRALQVTGLDVFYILTEHQDAKGRLGELSDVDAGTELIVRGLVPEGPQGKSSAAVRTILVRELARRGPPGERDEKPH